MSSLLRRSNPDKAPRLATLCLGLLVATTSRAAEPPAASESPAPSTPWISGFSAGGGLGSLRLLDGPLTQSVEGTVVSERLLLTAASVGMARAPHDLYLYGEVSWAIVGVGAGWHRVTGDPSDDRPLMGHVSLFLPIPVVWISEGGVRFVVPSLDSLEARAIVYLEPFWRQRFTPRGFTTNVFDGDHELGVQLKVFLPVGQRRQVFVRRAPDAFAEAKQRPRRPAL